jgi:hypothetical protein
MGAENVSYFCVGFRLAFHPCKGILQARLSAHYKEIFSPVVRRNSTRSSRRGAFSGWSEGLQGFGGGSFFFACFGRFLTVGARCSRRYGLLLCCKSGGAGLSGERKGFCGRDCVQFLAENVLETGCSKNNQKRRFLLYVVVLVDF